MNDLMNSIASAGDLESCTSDMRIMICIFLFMYVMLIFTMLIGIFSKFGK